MSIAHRAMRYDIHRRNLMYELWSYHDSKRNAMYELWSYHDNGFIIDELRYIISSMTFIMTRTVISSMYCTSSDDSMVLQAYILLDPSKENLYFRLKKYECLPTNDKKKISSLVLHLGSPTRVGSSLVAGFSFLPISMWVYIAIFEL